MHDLNKFQRDTLFVVASADGPTGAETKEALSEYYDKRVYDARLYPALDTLIEKGFVEKSELDGRTNEYRITNRGRREVAARLEWERSKTAELSVAGDE